MFRRVGVLVAALLVLSSTVSTVSTASPAFPAFPTTITLPNGFQPEGIAIGPGPVAYLGSLADGSIYRADLVTGRGKIVSKGPGTPSVGMKTDGHGKLYVSGGAAGNARVVDTRSGRILASYQLASGAAFINDVILTPAGAFFTDSVNPVLYRLSHGRVTTVPYSGALVYQEGFNVNGIARTPDGKGLIVVQSNTGKLFRVSYSGVTSEIALATPMVNGDGILLSGRTLYVVQNRLNTVAELRLDRGATRAEVKRLLSDPGFDVPTTIAAFGHRLYLPNARFTTPPTPDTTYTVVAIRG